MRTHKEKVVHRCQARALARMVAPAPWMMPAREVSVAPCHVCAGALEHVREGVGCLWPPLLLGGGPCTEGATGLTPGGAEATGEGTKRLARGHCPRGRDAVEILGRHARRLHGGGLQLRHAPWADLLAPIPRDARDRRWHFGHSARGLLETLQARLAASFLMSHGADGLDVVVDSPGQECAVATDASFQVDNVVGVTEGAEARSDPRALPHAVRRLVARCVHVRHALLQARG
jgi:hypothetical protein